MDFTKYDTRTAAEKAQFCQLRSQETGLPIFNDKQEPVGVMVLGTMARSVQEALRDDSRAKLLAARDQTKEEAASTLADIQAEMVKSAGRITTGFVNIERGDKQAQAPADCDWFYDLNMFSSKSILQPDAKGWLGLSFAQQVLRFADNTQNYLGND